MKKTLIISFVIILIISIIFGYIYLSKNNQYLEVTATSEDIQKKILDNLESELPAIIEIDYNQLKSLYKLDNIELENFSVNIPMMNMSATEIAIIKVKNINDSDKVKEKLISRSKVVAENQDKYLKEQYEIAKKPLIKVKGKYIIMSISEYNNDIENIFDSFFEVKK